MSFAWKQLKADYSKNVWKEENCGRGFVYPLIDYMSMKKKKIENCNSVGTVAHKGGKVVSFYPKFDPNFPDICK